MKNFAVLLMILASLLNSGCGQDRNLTESPSGPYAVGTKYLAFVDETRPEIFTVDDADYREITVQVWYPGVQDESVEYADYIEDAAETAPLLNLPEVYETMKSHSRLDLQLHQKEASYPVLLFNHGWGEHFSQNTGLMEELASHGYIVFSIAHHYECRFSFYPDGRIITFDLDNPSERFRKIMEEQSNPEALKTFRQMFEAKTHEEQIAYFRKANELMPTFLKEGARLWAQDVRFVIDRLEMMNTTPGFFEGRLNLTKIGVFGMSAGAIASQQVCLEDERCAAGVSMDGGLYGDSFEGTISQPFLFINSRRYVGYERLFLENLAGPGFVLTIPEADHYNFHEASVFEPAHPMVGDIDAGRMMEILNVYTLAFFEKYLRGNPSPLLDGTSKDYPEIDFFSKPQIKK